MISFTTDFKDLRTHVKNTGLKTAPTTYNSSSLQISMETSADYIKPLSKVYLTNENKINLDKTLLYMVNVTKAGKNREQVLSSEQFSSLVPMAAIQVLRFHVLSNLSECGLANIIEFRKSDTVDDNSLMSLVAQPTDSDLIDAQELYTIITTSALTLDVLQGIGRFAILCLIANALHRHATDGHNFIDHALSKKDSAASKVIGVAGAESAEFREFMRAYGHDLFHLLTNRSLLAIVDALTGVKVVDLAAPLFEVYEEGKKVHQAVTLPSAALDRWPPGLPGISSLILAIPLYISMVEVLDSKALMNDATTTGKAYEKLLLLIKSASKIMSRDQMLKIRMLLGPPLALAIGFNERYNSYDVDAHKSLKIIISNSNSDYLSGMNLGTIAKKKMMTDTEMEVAAKKRLDTMPAIDALVSELEATLTANVRQPIQVNSP